MIAGQDLEAGGSWMGVDAAGRFAAVTNFRELEQGPADVRSRGELVTEYLLCDVPPERYLAELAERANQYRGYNLLLTDGGELYCASNRGAPIRHLPPGIHGVSNGPLDSDWPKVKRGRQLLAKAVDRTEPSPKQLIKLLRDHTQPDDAALPDTGVGLEWERLLGTIAIDGAVAGRNYGTRSASVLLLDARGSGQFVEHSRMDDASWQQHEFPIGST
jgi:uncharacterized protein with NRDE domain